jgi:hypothetical protein
VKKVGRGLGHLSHDSAGGIMFNTSCLRLQIASSRPWSTRALSNLTIGVIAGLAAALTLCDTSHAAPQVSFSTNIETIESSVRDHPVDRPLALLFDKESIGSAQTEAILHAIDDRKRSGGLTIAIIGPVSDGASLIALSCDAIVALPNARLSGGDDQWCESPSRRDDLVEDVQRLGRLPEPLVRRLVESSGAFSWDKSGGFQSSDAGSLLLAQDGAKLEFSSAQLEQTGLSARGFKDLAAAVAAIDGRIVRARAAAPSAVAGSGGATPRGRPPLPPTNSPTNTPPNTPNTPPNTPTLPGSAAAASTVDMAKLSPKLKEYQTQLGELKSKVTEFDRYYQGMSGVWTSQHKSLRAVWDSKTEMTKDKDTKLRCSRLQQDIREVVTRLETITRSIEKICDDKNNPEVIRTAAALETMKEFREAIQRNEVDDYDKYKPLVMRLN